MMKVELGMPDKIFGVETAILKLMVMPGVVGVVMSLGVMLVYLPKIAEINKMIAQAKQLTKSTAEVNAKRNYLLSMDEKELNKNAELLAMAIPKDKDVYYLLNVIGRLAAKEGYTVDSFEIDPGVLKGEETGKTKSELVRIPVQAVLFGPKENFVELIGLFERGLPVLSIEKLDNKDRGGLNQLSITVATYFASDQVEVKMSSLTMSDLMMTEKETALIGQLEEFKKIEGLIVNDQELSSGKEYVRYSRNNPFTP